MANIATKAIEIIIKENSSVNTEWLECISEDLENGEPSHEQCYQLIKGFIRGLMVTGAVGVETLNDIDEINKQRIARCELLENEDYRNLMLKTLADGRYSN